MRRFAVMVAGALFALAGCGGSAGPSGPSKPQTAADVSQAEPTPATPATPRSQDPRLRMLDAGSEPRHAAAFSYRTGQQQAVRMRMDLQIQQASNGQLLQSPKLPTQQWLTDLRVDSVAADRSATVLWKVRSARALPDEEVPDAVIVSVNAAAQQVVGWGGSYEVTELAHVRSATMDELPEGFPAAVEQLMASFNEQAKQLAIPLPAEPIGVGGRWSMVDEVELNGIKHRRVAQYTVEQIDAEGAILNIEVKLASPDREIVLPGLGLPAKLDYLEGEGTGRTAIRWTELAPDMSLQMRIALGMALTIEGQPLHIDQHLKMRIEFSPESSSPKGP